jgi:hypothetical protein
VADRVVIHPELKATAIQIGDVARTLTGKVGETGKLAAIDADLAEATDRIPKTDDTGSVIFVLAESLRTSCSKLVKQDGYAIMNFGLDMESVSKGFRDVAHELEQDALELRRRMEANPPTGITPR